MNKAAVPDHPIDELLTKRWSPYAFDSRPVPRADLLSLFEAARWAASSYNEQPWHYIVATKDNPTEFQLALSCLVEGNQEWAKAAPVLALCVASMNFKLNGKPNKAAIHDLGLAACSLTLEATKRGLIVHQMIGIVPDKVRETYGVPAGYEPMTAMAIGYLGDLSALPEKLRPRDLATRTRRPLKEFVFGSSWGKPAAVVQS